MQTMPIRKIPLAAAAASLSFGACSQSELPPVAEHRLQQTLDEFAEALCKSYIECNPDSAFDIEGCKEYYDQYYNVENFSSLVASADNPHACLKALQAAFSCYTEYYKGLSCEELEAELDDYDSTLCFEQSSAFEEECYGGAFGGGYYVEPTPFEPADDFQ